MRNFLRSWWPRAVSRRGCFIAPRLERLENRIVFALSATPLPFTALDTAHVAAALTAPNAFDLYQVHLNAGDVVNIAVSSQASGGALQSNLRVFDATGRALALDTQQGGDPHLTFQAPREGDYLVGVSSAGDDAYDPAVAASGQGGATTGLYALDLQRELAVPLTPELAGSSFRLQADTAAYGDTISGTFTVDNRGGAAAGAFAVQVVLSPDNLFSQYFLVLTTFALPGLRAGQEFASGVFTMSLPDLAQATAAGLPVSGPVYLGLRIDPTGAVPEVNPHDQSGVHAGEDWQALTVVTPFTFSGINHSPADAEVLGDPNSRVRGVLTAGQIDWYQLTVPAMGRLTATVTTTGGNLAPRLTLSGPSGQVLIQSDDGSLVQHLPPGTYEVAVSGRSGAGIYQLIVKTVPASVPLEPVPVENLEGQALVADVNGDGKPDIVTLNYWSASSSDAVSVLLGNGDGTFQPTREFDIGKIPYSWLSVTDVNGDGKPDVIVLESSTYDPTTGKLENGRISVLLGNGDGTFQDQKTFEVGVNPNSVAVADLNGDGKPDLITANSGTYNDTTHQFDNSGVSVLLGNGNGTFRTAQNLQVGSYPSAVAVADLNGDGKPDLIIANGLENTVRVLLGNGDGTFQNPKNLNTDSTNIIHSLVVADVNSDGKPDIITASNDNIDVLLGNGDGTLQKPQSLLVGGAESVAVVDVNRDGKPDLIAIGFGQNTRIVLLGNGDGTFQKPQTYTLNQVQDGVYAMVAVADVNGDGIPDIVTANIFSNTVSVLLGNGDGTFQPQEVPQTIPPSPYFDSPPLAVADVNGDGKPDIISDNSVLLGNGDGTFQKPQTIPVGYSPALVVADVNGDGKPDLVYAGNDLISILLGNGDGTFQKPTNYQVALIVAVLVVADVNGDGKPDLIIANAVSYTDGRPSSVSVLLGNGDGSFQNPQTFSVGAPFSLAVADVNGDGKPDLVVANGGTFNPTTHKSSNSGVLIFMGKGDGSLGPPQTFDAGFYPSSVAVADINGDGKPDLVVGNTGTFNPTTQQYDNSGVIALLNKGDGTFAPPQTITRGSTGLLAVADVNGDGKPDLVVSQWSQTTKQHNVNVLLGKGDGTFGPPQTLAGSDVATSMAVADVNGDGRPDLIFPTIGVLLGKGNGSFAPASPITGVGLRNTPYLADLTDDGLPDSVVLNGAGAILFRKGLAGSDNPFDPPVILNPGRPARDLTVLHTAAGLALATTDASFDPALSGPNRFVYTVSLYSVAADGTVNRTTGFSTTLLPTRIFAADLTGNGLDDLIVANSLDNSIQVAFQQPDGSFTAPLILPTGQSPSDISVADVNGDGLPDIAVSNQVSGDVSVFLNDPQHSFVQSYRFRASTGLYGLDTSGATPTISSLEQSVTLVAGDFTGSGRNDLLVVNRGSDSFSVLANDGQGGFANPQAALTTSVSDGTEFNTQAGPTVAGHFHGPGQPLDVAILMKDRAEVWIFTGNGDGTFRHTLSIPAGDQPTGLNLFHNPQTGLDDLLVGDPFGDVLHLQGKGDGTFQIAGRRTTLAVQQLSNGQTDVLVANEQSDRVTIQTSQPGSSKLTPIVILADGTQSTLAPGAVQWAKLDKNSPYYDAIVVASGGNEVLVYRGTGFDPASGAPTFAAPVSYPVGTNPVSVTIQDLNGDSIPDLIVTNQGSNDVSLIFGSWDNSGNWVGTVGPRLKSGGSGPIAAQAVFPAGGGLPQLVITNGQSGTLAVLPGVGQGFFNDQNPPIVNLPGNPVLTQGPTFFGSSGSGVLLTATGQLLGFNLNDLAGSIGVVFAPAGDEVAAAQALADGHVVAVLDSGTVVDLAPVEGGLAVDSTFVPLTGIPSEPSALAVLQEESGMQVLVTAAGGDRVFAFGIAEPLGLPLVPVLETGPLVKVTPLAGEPLTVVVTLTAGTGPAGSVTAPASPATTLSTGVAAESLELSEADVLVPGLVTLGAVSPAWALGLLTRLPGSAPVEDAAGEVAVEVVPKPVAAAEKPRPAVDGLDLDKLLRELDLYQPTPSPERPGPTSGRLEEQRGPERLALTPSADIETLLADLAVPMAADLEASLPPADMSDAVLVQTPSSWSEERWRLLGLAGLALWPWPSNGFQSDGEAQRKPERPRGRPVNLCFRA